MATYNTIFYIGSSRQNSVSGGDGTEAPSASPTQTVESEAMQTTAAVMTSSEGDSSSVGEQTTQQQITQHTEMVCVTRVHMDCYILCVSYIELCDMSHLSICCKSQSYEPNQCGRR